jgi:hypothetical protein
MKRYYMEVTLKSGTLPDALAIERVLNTGITEGSELEARRRLLERVWANGDRVTRLKVMDIREIPTHD